MNDGYAPAGDDWIFYREAGSGQAVVFIHAGVADSRMWMGQLEHVPDGYHYVAYDQRGFGNTELGSGPFKDFQDVLALLDNLGIERAVLVGCSMGSGIALDVAIESPKRVSGLVLVGANSPGFEPDEQYESPQWPEILKEYEAGNLDRVAELDSEIWLTGYGREGHVHDAEMLSLFLEMDMKALGNEAERDDLRQKGPDRAKGILGIQKPSLVIVGEHDLPDLHEHAHHLAKRLSRRTAVVIDDTAHLPGLERPEAFNSILEGFLENI